jgi:hypothetical protein
LLAKKYEYIVIVSEGITYYYDMTNISTEGLPFNDFIQYLKNKYMIGDENISSALTLADGVQKRFEKYQLPIFVDDQSIQCGDSKNQNSKNEAYITDTNSFRFECITPILSIKGVPTKEKIGNVLIPFLSLFGLEHSNCFIVNHSMGFHVNISLYNTNNDYINIFNEFSKRSSNKYESSKIIKIWADYKKYNKK